MKYLLITSYLLFCTILAHGLNVTLPENRFLNFGFVAATATSGTQSFQITIPSGNGTVTAYVAAPFEVSLDNTNFNDSVYKNMASASSQTFLIYVRYKPTIIGVINKANVFFVQNTTPAPQKIYLLGHTYDPADYYSVASWNTKWFGNGSCNCDTAIQTQNAKTIMKYLSPDVFALQEIVDHYKMPQLCSYLGSNYDYLLPDFCSFAADTFDASYDNGQKTVFIYNKNVIEPLAHFGLGKSTYPAQSGNTSPYYYFSSGRFPFLMKAKITGTIDTVDFINIHAKSGSTSTDYQRRAAASKMIDDSIIAQYNNDKALLIGDYNDYTEGTNVTGFTTSPYDNLVSSSMKAISKPSQLSGQTTYVTIANSIIDNLAVTDELLSDYAINSFFIFNEADFVFNNYVSSTSDHFPVMAFFHKNKKTNAIANYGVNNSLSIVNPAQSGAVNIFNNHAQAASYQVRVMDMSGKVVINDHVFLQPEHNTLLYELAPQLYLISLQNTASKSTQHFKLLIQ